MQEEKLSLGLISAPGPAKTTCPFCSRLLLLAQAGPGNLSGQDKPNLDCFRNRRFHDTRPNDCSNLPPVRVVTPNSGTQSLYYRTRLALD
jgi:hypothetical protein